MNEAVKWDGFPVFGRDRNAWHLLNYDEAEHPVPMWWDWHLEAWLADPEAAFFVPAAQTVDAGYSYLAGTVTPSGLKEAIAEAVTAERKKNDALIRSLAVGYERMRGVLCKMAGTSGPDTSWYRHHADRGLNSVPGIWDIAKNPMEAEPGECSWINRDGSLEAIRSAAK